MMVTHPNDSNFDEENGIPLANILEEKDESHKSKLKKFGLTKDFFDIIKKEAKAIIKISFPIVLTNVLSFFIPVGTNIMAGRLSKVEYEAASLSLSTMGTFGWVLVQGFCTACDTLFSQTIGSGEIKRTGLWLQKSAIVINILVLFIIAVQINSEPIFLLIGQDQEVSRFAAECSTILCPGLIFFGNNFILMRYLQNLDFVYPPAVTTLVAVIFNMGSQYLCLHVFNWGFKSIPYCHMMSYFLLFFQNATYIMIFKVYRNTWDGFKRETLTAWSEIFALSLSGAFQGIAESFCYHLGLILAGTINATLLGTQTMLYNIDTIFYMAAWSFGIAVNIRTGRALGNRNSEAARLTFKVSVVLTVITMSAFGVVLISFRSLIPQIFTSYSDISEEASKVLPVVVGVLMVDGARVSFDGVIRGCGRQGVGALIMFVSYYGVGITMGLPLLLLTDLQLTGLWIGVLCGLITSLVLSIIFVTHLDFDKEGEKAQKRVMLRVENAAIPTEKTSLLEKEKSRVRYPREPRSCSTNFEFLSKSENISNKRFRKLLILRGMIILGSLVVVATSVLLRCFVFPGVIISLRTSMPSNGTLQEIETGGA